MDLEVTTIKSKLSNGHQQTEVLTILSTVCARWFVNIIERLRSHIIDINKNGFVNIDIDNIIDRVRSAHI